MLPPLSAVIAEIEPSVIEPLKDSALRRAFERAVSKYTKTDDPEVLRECLATNVQFKARLRKEVREALFASTSQPHFPDSGASKSLLHELRKEISREYQEERETSMANEATPSGRSPHAESATTHAPSDARAEAKAADVAGLLGPLEQFNAARRLTGDLYAKLRFGDRFRVTETSTFISYALCTIVFVMWWLLLPPVRFADLALISGAFAADGPATILDPKVVIHVAVFAALLVVFLLSVWVHFFGRNVRAMDSGERLATTLAAFFVGVGTKYLQL